jgi:hypothetical protein
MNFESRNFSEFGPSQELDMTESRFSLVAGSFVWCSPGCSGGVDDSEVPSNVRCATEELVLIILEDVTVADAELGAVCLLDISRVGLEFCLLLFLLLPMMPMRRC